MCGATPKYLSLALIIEEGLKFDALWKILVSISEIARENMVEVVTGDTKVVDRGKGDQLFINTSGIGELHAKACIGIGHIQAGDHILVSGQVATHGMAIMSVREGLEFETSLCSDTCYVGDITVRLINSFGHKIHFLRDPTRGGLATTLCEIASKSLLSVRLEEASIPVHPQARSACEMLGLDPLYVANEGVFVAVVAPEVSAEALEIIRSFKIGRDAAMVGMVTDEYPGKVVLRSGIGGKRILPMLPGEQLPRIC